MFEVEQKFRVADFEAIEGRLASLGASIGESAVQADSYFAHPARDFASTDEALRIRQVGQDNFITYKGPKIDAGTKTRREIELPFAPGGRRAEQLGELLQALSFTPVAVVRKARRQASTSWAGWEFDIALDQVEQVGQFVELEVTADESQLDAARHALHGLAAELELDQVVRTSYLELLLNSD